ncbi:MAG: hypothetical protein J0L50_05375 [Sphingomonadales bacterium]|nr:hypothetical protein [Sphingomonadales bacterium]
MRKIMILAAASGLALALSACSKSEEAAPAETAAATEAAPAESDAVAATASEDADEATEAGDDRGNTGDRG